MVVLWLALAKIMNRWINELSAHLNQGWKQSLVYV